MVIHIIVMHNYGDENWMNSLLCVQGGGGIAECRLHVITPWCLFRQEWLFDTGWFGHLWCIRDNIHLCDSLLYYRGSQPILL